MIQVGSNRFEHRRREPELMLRTMQKLSCIIATCNNVFVRFRSKPFVNILGHKYWIPAVLI